MNKILEYMALGKPIVQFDLKEGRVSAADASLYARKNDAEDFAAKIHYLLENGEERSRMGELGIERVSSRLSWPHQEAQLVAAYESFR